MLTAEAELPGPLPVREGRLPTLRTRRPACLSWAVYALGAVLLEVAWRPQALTRAQFYAEDGQAWFADAYNHGPLRTLFMPLQGYWQAFPRLAALACEPFGFLGAPLAFNILGTAVETIPPLLIASRRFERIIPSRALRMGLGFAYVAIPYRELHFTITNSQWHLAVAALLVIISEPPWSRLGRIADLVLVAIAGLSGPYAVALAPAAFAVWCVRRGLHRRNVSVLLGVSALVEVGFLLSGMLHGGRQGMHLGVSLTGFLVIIVNHIVLTFDGWAIAQFQTVEALAVIFVIGAFVTARALVKGSLELRVVVLVCLAVFAGALVDPYGANESRPAWVVLSIGALERYYLFPTVGWLAVVVWTVGNLSWRRLRIGVGGALALWLLITAPGGWRDPGFVDQHPDVWASRLAAAPPGERVRIPINPPWWSMTLIKHE